MSAWTIIMMSFTVSWLLFANTFFSCKLAPLDIQLLAAVEWCLRHWELTEKSLYSRHSIKEQILAMYVTLIKLRILTSHYTSIHLLRNKLFSSVYISQRLLNYKQYTFCTTTFQNHERYWFSVTIWKFLLPSIFFFFFLS